MSPVPRRTWQKSLNSLDGLVEDDGVVGLVLNLSF